MVTANEAPNGSENSAAQSFFSETEHIPAEVQGQAQSINGNSAAAQPAAVPGWTPEEVAQQFIGLFASAHALLPVLRPGPVDHWDLAASEAQTLGAAFCPIFQRHIPYGVGAPAWLADAMMYLAAAGALQKIVMPAVQAEVKLLKQARKKKPGAVVPFPNMQPESTAENTPMDTSAESSSSPESAEAEKAFSNYES